MRPPTMPRIIVARATPNQSSAWSSRLYGRSGLNCNGRVQEISTALPASRANGKVILHSRWAKLRPRFRAQQPQWTQPRWSSVSRIRLTGEVRGDNSIKPLSFRQAKGPLLYHGTDHKRDFFQLVRPSNATSTDYKLDKVLSVAHSLVVMLAVVLIKRELHNLDGRLPLRYETRKRMEPLAGFAAPSEAVGRLNQGQFARTRLLRLRLFPRHAHRLEVGFRGCVRRHSAIQKT